MGTIKVNAIEKHDNNQIALNSVLQLKSNTTTQRDALSSPHAGLTINNTTTNKKHHKHNNKNHNPNTNTHQTQPTKANV